MTALRRELWLLWRDRGACLWLALALLLAMLALAGGLAETRQQRDLLTRAVALDKLDREASTVGQSDWGGVAYYSFHLTYDPPSEFAFAALGQRDSAAWKHRIRMLALEGQIYESDAGHPEFALLGRFDFAFVAALLAPLLLVLLLHDLRASERREGRYDLLCATAGDERKLWRQRAALRCMLLALCLLLPLAVAGLIAGTALATLLLAALAVVLHLLFWWLLCTAIDPRPWTGATKLTALIGIWLLLAVLLPALLQMLIERRHPLPAGAEIVLTQREAVNRAWDLPKAETMQAFLERHPEWTAHAEITNPFDWKWYYAFQQVGDQRAETLSQSYRDGVLARERTTAALAWLAPPSWLQRRLQSLAATDVASVLAYERSVRDFHAALRAYYYPKLFLEQPVSSDALACRPQFVPARPGGVGETGGAAQDDCRSPASAASGDHSQDG